MFFILLGLSLLFTQQANAQDCSVWEARDELPSPRRGCAPFTYIVTIVRYVEKTVPLSDITIGMHWGDGDETWTVGEFTTAGGSIDETSNPTYRIFRLENVSHIYPVNALHVYQSKPFMRLPYNCDWSDTYNVTVWSTDDQGSGQPVFVDGESSSNEYLVCAGQPIDIDFWDRSVLAANFYQTDPLLAYTSNQRDRYTQFTYGVDNVPVGPMIPSVSVGGVPVTNSGGALISGAPFAEVEKKWQIQTYNPMNHATPKITVPAGVTEAGQRFTIQLQNRNECGYAAPITASIFVQPSPPNPVQANLEFCHQNHYTGAAAGTSKFSHTVSHVEDLSGMTGGTYVWYNDNGSGTAPGSVKLIEKPGNTFNPATTADIPATVSSHRLNPSTAGNKYYWVKYVVTRTYGTTVLTCESAAVRMRWTVRADISGAPGTLAPMAGCPQDVIRLEYPSAPAYETYGGATKYVWEYSINGGAYTVDGNLVQSPDGKYADLTLATTPAGSTNSTIQVRVHREWVTPIATPASTGCLYSYTGSTCAVCPGAPSIHSVTVYPKPKANITNGGTICSDENIALTINNLNASRNASPPYYRVTVELNGGAAACGAASFNLDFATANASTQYTVNPAAGTATRYTITKITDRTTGCVSTATTPEITGNADVYKRAALTAPASWDAKPADDLCETTSYQWTAPATPGVTLTPCNSPAVSAQTVEYKWTSSAGWGVNANTNSATPTYPLTSSGYAESPNGTAQSMSVAYRYSTAADRSPKTGDAKYCPSPVLTHPVTVIPTPRATVVASTQTICNTDGASVTVNLSGVANSQWTVNYRLRKGVLWSSPAPSSISVTGTTSGTATATISIPTGDFAPTKEGEYTFELVSVTQDRGNCTGIVNNTAAATIIVREVPTATLSGDNSTNHICENMSYTIAASNFTLTGFAGGTNNSYTVSISSDGPVTTRTYTNLHIGDPLLIPADMIKPSTALTTITITAVSQIATGLTCTGTFSGSFVIYTDVGPDAGPDKFECSSSTITLGATPQFNNKWVAVGYDAITFPGIDDDEKADAILTKKAVGVFRYAWVNSAGCADTVVVTFDEPARQAVIDNTNVVCGQTIQLQGKTSDGALKAWETGTWSLVSSATTDGANDGKIIAPAVCNDETLPAQSPTPPGHTISCPIHTPNPNVTVDKPGTYTFRWEVRTSCSFTVATIDVTFKQVPVTTPIANFEMCEGDSSTVTFLDTDASFRENVIYTWTHSGIAATYPAGTYPAAPVPSTVTGTVATISAPEYTQSSSDVYHTISVTGTKNGCSGAPMDFKVTAKPKPHINPLSDQELCPRQSVTLDINPTLTNMTGGIDYEWAGDPGTHPNAAITSGSIHLPTAPYPYQLKAGPNTSGADQTGGIAITAKVRGCKSDSMRINVRVKPQPIIDFDPPTGEQEYCSLTNLEQSDLTQFYTNVPGAAFEWTYTGMPSVGFSGTNQPATMVASTSPPRYTVPPFTTSDNITGGNRTGTVTVRASSEGCDTTRTFNIIVKPRPVITLPVLPEEKCALPTTAAPSAANKFSDIVPAPAFGYNPTYRFWVRDAAFHNDVNGLNLDVNNSATGASMTDIWVPTSANGVDSVMRVVVYPTLTGCAGDSVEVRYTAHPLPVVQSVADQYVCPGEFFENAAFTTNMPSNLISNIQWTFTGPNVGKGTTSGLGTLTSFQAVNNTSGVDISSPVSVVATSTFACVSEPATIFNYTVFPEPVIDNPAAASPDRFCSDIPVTFADFSTNISKPGAEINYSWDIDRADIGLTPTSGSGSSTVNYKIPDFTSAKNLTGTNITGIITMNATTNDLSQTGQYCWTRTPKTIQLILLTAPRMNPINDIAVCPETEINNITIATNLGGVTESDFRWKLTEPGSHIYHTTTPLPVGSEGSGYIPPFKTTAQTPPPSIEGTFEVWARIDMGSNLYCWGDTTEFKVTVKRRPDVILPQWGPGDPKAGSPQDTLFYCTQELVPAYTFGSSDAGSVSYRWSSTGGIGLTLSGSQTGSAVPSFTTANNADNGKHILTSNFIVQSELNGCYSDTARFTYIVGPKPQATVPTDQEVCAGDPVIPDPFVPGSDVTPAYTYSYPWSIPNGMYFTELRQYPTTVNDYTTSGNSNLPPFVGDTAHIYPLPSGNGNALWGTVPKNFVVKVTPQYTFTALFGTKTCTTRDTAYVRYTINPLPITELMKNEDRCVQDGEAKLYQVKQASAAVGSVYTWGLEDTSQVVIPMPTLPLGNPDFPGPPNEGAPRIRGLDSRYEVYEFPPTARDWAGYVTVKEENVFGCFSPVKKMAVSVITAPSVRAVSTMTKDTTTCAGEAITLNAKLLSPVPNPGIKHPTLNPGGEMTYEWFPMTSVVQGEFVDGMGIPAEMTLNPVVRPYTATQLTLRAEIGGCYSKRDTVLIKVGRTPAVPFIPDKTYCESVDEYILEFFSTVEDPSDAVRWFRGIRDINGKWLKDKDMTPVDTLVVLPGADNQITVDMKDPTEPDRLPSTLDFLGGNEEASIQYGIYLASAENCVSDTALTTLRIRKIPVSPIADTTFYCRNNQTNFLLTSLNNNTRWYKDTTVPPNPFRPGVHQPVFNGPLFDVPIAASATGTDTVFYITQSAANGCQSLYAKKNLIVHPNPIINFALPDTAGCADFETLLTNNVSDPAVDYIVNWGDSQSDTLTTASLPHTYVNNTAYNSFSLLRFDAISKVNRDENGIYCSVSKNRQIVVFPKIQVDFTASQLQICDQSEVDAAAQMPINFYATTSNATEFKWEIGESPTVTNNQRSVNHIFKSKLTGNDKYQQLDSTQVTLTAGSGPITYGGVTYNCNAPVSKWVRIMPVPKSEFQITDPDGNVNPPWVCSPSNLTFDNLNWTAGSPPNYGKNGNDVRYYWDIDGSDNTGIDTVYRFNNSSFVTRAATVSLLVTNLTYGCSASSQYTVQVMPRLMARFDPEITEGCTPTSIRFVSDSPGARSLDWFWDSPVQPSQTAIADLSVSSSETEVEHQFDNPGRTEQKYHVWLRTSVGTTLGQCYMYADTMITIYPVPPAAFEVTPTDLIYPNTSVLIRNLIDPTKMTGLYFEWNLLKRGQTTPKLISISPDPGQYAINDWGTFDLIQHVSTLDGKCPTELKREIRIVPPNPIASFDAVPPACSPYEVRFQNTSKNANSYLWSFGDGRGNSSISASENPIHTYADPGYYIVTLIAFGDAILPDTSTRAIQVNPVPEAIFTVSPQYMYANQIAYTFNHTSNITPAGEVYGIWYRWDLGDGSDIDTTLNTAHIYTKPGKYDVTLTVGTYGEPQCISTRTIKEAVEVVSAGEVVLPNSFKPDVTGEPSDVVPNEQSYRNYLFFPPVIQPTREYHLAVYQRWGQLIYQTNDPTRGWNGYFKGQLCPEGVYVYQIWGTFENGESFRKRGDILLLR
ncbi:hypothetical protein FACS189430_01200 [Bacteroidia bacterium]|nr:hypothetical protein FACS189430_01200 [Bacteroidia bacterium]